MFLGHTAANQITHVTNHMGCAGRSLTRGNYGLSKELVLSLTKAARKVLPKNISNATQSRQVFEPGEMDEVRVLESKPDRQATGTEPHQLRHDRSLNWIVGRMDSGDARR